MSSVVENETPLVSNSEIKQSESAKGKSGKNQLPANDFERFKHGVLIRGKFIGVEDVKNENGDDVCQTAMIKLKAVVLAKKEHKQRICVKINLEGIEILDEKTNQLMFKHSVSRISYIARDSTDSRAIGYIYKNSPNNYQYFAIKTERQAQELFNNLKDLFEVVLEMRNAEKSKKKEIEPTEPVNETHNENHETKDIEVKSNETDIKTATDSNKPTADNLLDFPSENIQNSFEETIDTNVLKKQSSTDELLDVFDNSVTNFSSSENHSIQVNNSNQYEKKNSLINELTNLSISPQSKAPSIPLGQQYNSNIYPSYGLQQNSSSLNFQQQQQQQQQPHFSIQNQNPFGTFNIQPNQQQAFNKIQSIESSNEIQAFANQSQSNNLSASNQNQNNFFSW